MPAGAGCQTLIADVTTRTLTLLFTDLVGSTELLTSIGAGASERLLERHLRRLGEHVDHRCGEVIKNLGDGVIATFGCSRDALDAAVAIQRDPAGSLNGDRRPLSVRVGISSGDVTTVDGDCFGRAVVEASRLCARARGGQILVAESSRLLAAGYEGLVELGTYELKGLPELMRVWEATWSPVALAPLRAVLADDAVLVREGVARVLEAAGIEVVGQAGDANRLLSMTAELRPDLAIVDVRMPPTHTTEGLRAAQEIRRRHPQTAVLMLSQDLQPAYAAQLLDVSQSAVGYLLKERVTDLREFADAARAVASGGTAFDQQLFESSQGERP